LERNLLWEEKWLSFPEGENMMSATSTSHSTANSYAFLIKPLRLLEKVTWREVVLSILTIGTFTLPIYSERSSGRGWDERAGEQWKKVRCLERGTGIGIEGKEWRGELGEEDREAYK
jgi:hypothetical protein